MAKEAVATEVPVSADQAWALVGDFQGIGQWFPGIDSVRPDGDDRVLSMFGMEIRERLLERDDAARAITYSIVDGVPVEHHQATVSVTPTDRGSTITWAFEAEPDSMVPLLADSYKAALAALKEKLH
ncbi:MAG TPA: SRPBCC family protein [Acidimicrobiales bacterium]|nr:SRPBCC family protein [Acidimicrobiales bacterium]